MTENSEKIPENTEKIGKLGKLKHAAEAVVEEAEKLPAWTLNTLAKKPTLIVIRGLGRGKRAKYDVEGDKLIITPPSRGRGNKGWTASYTPGSIITLGRWLFARPQMFVRLNASRCVDFQKDLDAPGFTEADAENVFKGGLMEWWKSYKGNKLSSILTLILGANFVVAVIILITLWQ